MANVFFKTYTEAASYAKRRAQESGVSVKFGRSNEEWVVFLESEHALADSDRNDPLPDRAIKPPDAKRLSSWERHREEERKAWEVARRAEKRRMDDEEKSREADAKEREERRPYIEERGKHYRSLSERQLNELWNKRANQNLEPDETALLRAIDREAKGITPTYKNNLKVCRQCGMVGDSCTCERSWF